MPFIHFGIKGSFGVHLLPDIGNTELKLEHSIVSGNVSAQSFEPSAIWHHAQQMFKLGLQIGLYMAEKGLIATSADNVKLYLYDDGDATVNTDDINGTNISTVTFTPRGQSMACMPAGLVKAKASSAGGLNLMWKPATQFTAAILLNASSWTTPLKLNGAPIFYTSGFRSVAGNTMPRDAKGKPGRLDKKASSVAVLIMARGTPATANELNTYYSDETQLRHMFAAALLNMPASSTPSALVVHDDSPDILGDLLGDFSPPRERQILLHARSEVSQSLQVVHSHLLLWQGAHFVTHTAEAKIGVAFRQFSERCIAVADHLYPRFAYIAAEKSVVAFKHVSDGRITDVDHLFPRNAQIGCTNSTGKVFPKDRIVLAPRLLNLVQQRGWPQSWPAQQEQQSHNHLPHLWHKSELILPMWTQRSHKRWITHSENGETPNAKSPSHGCSYYHLLTAKSHASTHLNATWAKTACYVPLDHLDNLKCRLSTEPVTAQVHTPHSASIDPSLSRQWPIALRA